MKHITSWLWVHRHDSRAWLHAGRHTFGVEFSKRSRLAPSISLRWGKEVAQGDGGIQFHIALIASLFLSWEMPMSWQRRMRFPSYERRFGMRWFMGRFQVELFSDGWGRSIGMSDNEHIVTLWNNEWVTGKPRFTRRTIAEGIEGEFTVEPGETYRARLDIEEFIWRTRFRTKRRLDAHMNLIHEPGERFPETRFHWGDNDGIFGCGFDLTDGGTVEDAFYSYGERVRRDRERYNYTPSWERAR